MKKILLREAILLTMRCIIPDTEMKLSLSKQCFLLAWICGLIFPCMAAQPFQIQSAAELAAQLDQTSGDYTIEGQSPDWKFNGELGSPATRIAIHQGQDQIGAYQEIAFQWQSEIPLNGSIRLYDSLPAALFTIEADQPVKSWPVDFPCFTKFPQKLHHFSFADRAFSPPSFRLETNGTPWLLFDDDANAVLISPANHFMLATMKGDGTHKIASGINAEVQNLPAHFTYHTLMVFAPGIHTAWQTWSTAFLKRLDATPPANDADVTLRYLGYWTDNGATYSYKYDPVLGFAGTLEKVVAQFRAKQVPVRYLQMDSWWYPKTFTSPEGKSSGLTNPRLPPWLWNRSGGLFDYTAAPELFPNGLADFQKSIGVQLIAHNRWMDPNSPYHQEYQISGLAPIDPKWWEHIMDYLASSGATVYEQDWLHVIYDRSPDLGKKIGIGDAFTGNMARSARDHGLSVQYCSALPRFFLQGARYPNVITIRTSADRFSQLRWNNFLYTSQFARAVGIWPWSDVFMSGETNNLLISVLSAGAVGVGDGIGQMNAENLSYVARPDGVLVKPDESLVPLDSVYIADAKRKSSPMIAWTYTDHQSLRTAYVFAYNRQRNNARGTFTPAKLGLSGKVCVFDERAGTARFQPADSPVEFELPAAQSVKREVEVAVAAIHPVKLTFTPAATAYYLITDVGRSGLAFFGDADKFVSNGRQRIASLADTPGRLTVTVTFAAGEKSVRLFGYADHAPQAVAQRGSAGKVMFNQHSRRFSVEVKPSAEIIHKGPDPTQTAIVVFTTQ